MFGTSSFVVAATLWVLIGFSLLTWTLIVMKGRLQWRLERLNRGFREAFWAARDLAAAEALAGSNPGPLSRVSRPPPRVSRLSPCPRQRHPPLFSSPT